MTNDDTHEKSKKKIDKKILCSTFLSVIRSERGAINNSYVISCDAISVMFDHDRFSFFISSPQFASSFMIFALICIPVCSWCALSHFYFSFFQFFSSFSFYYFIFFSRSFSFLSIFAHSY